MTDDGNAPTIPNTQAPTHGPSSPGAPKPPDPRYALRNLLGRGGMGEVWLARDLRVDRDIAIKVMRGGSDDADAVARFLREARVQGRLEHPNVVPIHDLGGEQGAPFFAMKRLTGTTLADVIQARDDDKWSRRILLARFIDICLAIEFAHQRGVIHRDLKPANIMLGDFGETYVLDWGLARIADAIDSDAIRHTDLRGDSGVASGHTAAGAMLGTPGYMAPEQMRGDPIDLRVDVYALGCILFEILCGQPAIPRDRALEVTLTAPCHRPIERNGDVPPELDEACANATSSDCDARTGSARQLADAVQRFLDGDRDLARRRELAAGHAQRAHALLASATTSARAEAMREAGSAIALDANNRDAQAVLARLLIEPPPQIPDAARAAIEQERQSATYAMIRRAIAVMVAFATIPLIASRLGTVGSWPIAILLLEDAALVTLLSLVLWRRWRISSPLVLAATLLHVLLLVTCGIVLGPLLVLPMLVFGSLPIFIMLPAVRSLRTTTMLHALALALPLVLELLSVVPRTFAIRGSTLELTPWALSLSPQAMLFVFFAIFAFQVVGVSLILDGMRRAQDRAQEQLHLQKWHLEQLVPTRAT